MPWNRADYPQDWNDLRAQVLERAGYRCEWCGAEQYKPNPKTGSRVVLTCAHLDHDTRSRDLGNLAALCQCCHLGYDAGMHAAHASTTRARKGEAFGQLGLGLDGK